MDKYDLSQYYTLSKATIKITDPTIMKVENAKALLDCCAMGWGFDNKYEAIKYAKDFICTSIIHCRMLENGKVELSPVLFESETSISISTCCLL